MSIYLSPIGDSLADPACFPPEIHQFLEAEEVLLLELSKPFDTIIEACCAKGTYASLFLAEGKEYIGIDIAAHHIEDAQRMYPGGRFICGNVNALDEMPGGSALTNCLVIFPFNAFGNLSDGKGMLRILAEAKVSFIISTYTNEKLSEKAREEYYSVAGFGGLRCLKSKDGVRFTDDIGFDSIAYHQVWFGRAFAEMGLPLRCVPFGDIGTAYMNF